MISLRSKQPRSSVKSKLMKNKVEEDRDKSPKSRHEEYLLEARTIVICGEIDQELAKNVTEKLIILAQRSDDPIKLFINSQGGHVESGDTIFDMIQFVSPEVKIVGTGWVASCGALIYASVPRKDRFSLPNTRYMMHQPMGGAGGQVSDISIEAKELIKTRKRLNEIFARQTGQELEKVAKDFDRNYWMDAKEAFEYGLVGKIIQSSGELGA
jgi:ATP-dependent Clp protease, protease subunit